MQPPPPSPGPSAPNPFRGAGPGRFPTPPVGPLTPGGTPPSAGRAPLQLGPCRLLSKLGEGGFGAVYRAHHLRMARDVAVKVLPPLSGPRARVQLERFRREGLAAARVSHPNVARVLDLGLEPVPYLVQELVEGSSLDAQVARRGPLPIMEVVAIGRQLVQGLEAIHAAGLVHRDLKPGNVLLTGEGEVKIVDFGVVSFGEEPEEGPRPAAPPALSASADGRLTVDGAMVGTPWFMAPEQVRSRAGKVGPAADVFALGAVLYFCLSGRPPHLIDESDGVFELVARRISEPPEPIERADLPADVGALLEELLAPDPSARPSLEQALERLLRPAARVEPEPGAPAEVPRGALAAVGLALVPVALLALALGGGGDPASSRVSDAPLAEEAAPLPSASSEPELAPAEDRAADPRDDPGLSPGAGRAGGPGQDEAAARAPSAEEGLRDLSAASKWSPEPEVGVRQPSRGPSPSPAASPRAARPRATPGATPATPGATPATPSATPATPSATPAAPGATPAAPSATPAPTAPPAKPPRIPPRGAGYVSAARGVPPREVLLDLSGEGEVPAALRPWWSEEERALISPAGTQRCELPFGELDWQDLELSVDVVPLPREGAGKSKERSSKRGQFGLGFRRRGETRYALLVDADDPRGSSGCRLFSTREGELESWSTATKAGAFREPKRRRLRLRVAGNQVQLSIDGMLALEWAPLERRGGQLALLAPGGFAFVDLFVRRVELPKEPKSPRSSRHRVRLIHGLESFEAKALRSRREDFLGLEVRWTSDGRIVGVGDSLILEEKLTLPSHKGKGLSFQRARQRYGERIHDLRTVFERLPSGRRRALALFVPEGFAGKTNIRKPLLDLAERRKGAALVCDSTKSLAYARREAPRLQLVWNVKAKLARSWPRGQVVQRVLAELEAKQILPPVAVVLPADRLSAASVAALQRRRVVVYARPNWSLTREAAQACLAWRVDALVSRNLDVWAVLERTLEPRRKR